MEKELKDYLHLYLGCECQFIASGSEQRTIEYGKVVEMPLHGTEWALINSEFEEQSVKCFAFYHDIKPILRPLSDMTKEESKELDSINGDIVVEHGLKSMYDLADPEKMRYCLIKHFDIFGLIESGIAIDKTKTPTPHVS